MTTLRLLDQWDDYVRGWQILVNSGDILAWNVLLLVAFLVRSIAFIMLLVSLAERLYFERQAATRKIILSFIVLLLVTLPFYFAGLPLVYPKF